MQVNPVNNSKGHSVCNDNMRNHAQKSSFMSFFFQKKTVQIP